MKKLLLFPSTTLIIVAVFTVLTLGTTLAPQTALATTYTYRSSAHPYNYVFNLHGQTRHVTNNDELRSYLEDLISYLQQIHDTLPADSYYSNSYDDYTTGDITTHSATNVTRDGATLHGEFTGSGAVTAWFEFGKNTHSLSNTSDAVRITRSGSSFDLSLSGLIDNTTYYFRTVAEDRNGNTIHGDTLHFTTNTSGNSNHYSNNGTTPDVTTRSATSISTNSAHLRGSIDMNDFDNGRAFFVYGEDEQSIDNVPDDFSNYAEVYEDGDNLQKVSVDTNLDTTATYDEAVSGLNRDTDHFYRLCVAYQDDNDDTLECGSVMDFTTDN
jgi:hypothetical protein